MGEVTLEAAAYAVDLDGTERAASSEWKKKTLKIQVSYMSVFLEHCKNIYSCLKFLVFCYPLSQCIGNQP